MKCYKYISLLVGMMLFSMTMSAQNITNQAFYQEGRTIVVTYHLDRMADVILQVSMDGGKTFSAPLRHVTGNVGQNVQPGDNRIVWDVLAEYEQLISDNVIFKLTANGSKRSFVVNGVTFNMIYVQGGTFRMGGIYKDAREYEKPVHDVTLNSYYIGETEVTQALWEAVMGTTVYQQRDKANPQWAMNSIGPNYPIYFVTWEDCQEFTQNLSLLLDVNFRLPTEAEWEYAARGGKKCSQFRYSGSHNILDVACSVKSSNGHVHSVAEKRPNDLKIYDMSGNVWEWCNDWFGYHYYVNSPSVNPLGPPSGKERVMRGGGYIGGLGDCLVYTRATGECSSRVGLRIVLVIE